MGLAFSSSSDEEDNARLPRLFRERINTEFRSEYEFNERFRMTSVKMEELVSMLGPALERPTKRNQALDTKLQICIALHWLGSGAQYHTVADMHGVSKAAVCRAVHSVVEATNRILFPAIVKWPTNVVNLVTRFHSLAGMPVVVGCIDGILIDIDAPTYNEEHFVDRHGNHSINCMAVCGPDCQFYYISARWPGSVHDSRVLRNSSLFTSMENGWRLIPGGVLLGDSGYPLRHWLLTPTGSNTNDLAVARYNRAHKSTRRVIENSFGILREKFPCLNHLRVNPEFACNIFKCCTTLCNIVRTTQDEELVLRDSTLNDNEDEPEGGNENADINGVNRLSEMIAYFN